MKSRKISELQEKLDYLSRHNNDFYIRLQRLQAEIDELECKLKQLYTFVVALVDAISGSVIAEDDVSNLKNALFDEFEKLNDPEARS